MENTDYKVINNPSHNKIKTDISIFIKQIIQVTSVVPRLEGVFRKDRDVIVEEQKQIILYGGGPNGTRPDMSL